MSTKYKVHGRFLLSVFALAYSGCAKEPASTPPAVVEEEVVEEVEVPVLSTDGPSDDITAAMAELDETNRAAALAQKVCPVSDEPLGAMGKPIKVTVKGRDVFLCCESCREGLLAEPDKYLAKLDAK